MIEDPCVVFRELQSTSWHALKTCHERRISLGEDAITTLLLVNIATRLQSKVVYSDTRPIESTTGCDFELLIGSATIGWYRYAIQAKRINIPNQRYDNLDHKVGAAKTSQRLILQAYATAKKAKPLYCFFNYIDSIPPLFGPLYGITIAPLRVVTKAVSTYGGRKFDWIHGQAGVVPWSALVCPTLSTGGALGTTEHLRKKGEQFHSENVPADLAMWFDRGSIPSTALKARSIPLDAPALTPSAAVLVDLGDPEVVLSPARVRDLSESGNLG